MVKKAQREEMRDYVVEKLRASGLRAEPRRRALSKSLDFETDYVLIGKNEGVVLLIGQQYPGNSFKQIYDGVGLQIPNRGALIFKDGETFFRSAVAGQEATGIKSKAFKAQELSLKKYNGQLDKLISLRPEELAISRDAGKPVQYYQPSSSRLAQGIVSFRFKPVVLNYSHLSAEERHGPVERDSARLSIWTAKGEALNCPLELKNGFLYGAEPAVSSETLPEGYFPGKTYAVGEREKIN